ncbi:MAG: DUF167 domain-containing protein [Alphaproteobacteria bacterium]|nr:DUF167 domain-containing protein [Alphaproteobacteria bacterium]
MNEAPYFQNTSNGILIKIKASPGASSLRLGDWIKDPDGWQRLKIYVTAPPEKGKANQQIIKLLAGTLRIPSSRLEIINGTSGSRKTLLIKRPTENDLQALLKILKGD